MAPQRQLDRFKLSLAVVDVLGIIAFFWTAQWLILVYLALFNFLIIFIDVLRRGMVVHPKHDAPQLPDDIPIDPDTGNLYTGGFSAPVTPQPKPVATSTAASTLRNVPSTTPFARKAEDPFAGVEREVASPRPTPATAKDPQRQEIENVLEEWGSK